MTEVQTKVKERPILFSGAMVRALLAGTKTQTRRAVGLDFINENPGCWQLQWIPAKDCKYWLFTCGDDQVQIACPYGVEGNRLWVRETFKYGNTSDAFCTEFQADLDRIYWESEKADALPEAGKLQAGWMDDKPWTPSIHMPRWACRILLEITAVRCERLRDISDSDAIAEGVEAHNDDPACFRDYLKKEAWFGGDLMAPYSSYATLWASINGPQSWAANPWVWVVEFKVTQPN